MGNPQVQVLQHSTVLEEKLPIIVIIENRIVVALGKCLLLLYILLVCLIYNK